MFFLAVGEDGCERRQGRLPVGPERPLDQQRGDGCRSVEFRSNDCSNACSCSKRPPQAVVVTSHVFVLGFLTSALQFDFVETPPEVCQASLRVRRISTSEAVSHVLAASFLER